MAAVVPPAPNTSSSGCGEITTTRPDSGGLTEQGPRRRSSEHATQTDSSVPWPSSERTVRSAMAPVHQPGRGRGIPDLARHDVGGCRPPGRAPPPCGVCHRPTDGVQEHGPPGRGRRWHSVQRCDERRGPARRDRRWDPDRWRGPLPGGSTCSVGVPHRRRRGARAHGRRISFDLTLVMPRPLPRFRHANMRLLRPPPPRNPDGRDTGPALQPPTPPHSGIRRRGCQPASFPGRSSPAAPRPRRDQKDRPRRAVAHRCWRHRRERASPDRHPNTSSSHPKAATRRRHGSPPRRGADRPPRHPNDVPRRHPDWAHGSHRARTESPAHLRVPQPGDPTRGPSKNSAPSSSNRRSVEPCPGSGQSSTSRQTRMKDWRRVASSARGTASGMRATPPSSARRGSAASCVITTGIRHSVAPVSRQTEPSSSARSREGPQDRSPRTETAERRGCPTDGAICGSHLLLCQVRSSRPIRSPGQLQQSTRGGSQNLPRRESVPG